MKLLKVALVALALPVVASAQAPQPGPGGPMTNVYRLRTLNYQRLLAQAFDSIPESKFSYKPTPAQLTIGYIAQHLASDNYFYCGQFGAQKPTLTAEDSLADSVKAVWPKAKLVEKLKTSFAFCESALAPMTDQLLAEVMTIPGPNGQTRQAVRMQYVLGHVTDMVDHYSQLANYMRLNGMLPPSALPRPRPGAN